MRAGNETFPDAMPAMRHCCLFKARSDAALLARPICMQRTHIQVLSAPARQPAPCRRTAELQAIASPDENQGVRSVQLTEQLLSFGTGKGKLFFYDVRAQAFLPTGVAARMLLIALHPQLCSCMLLGGTPILGAHAPPPALSCTPPRQPAPQPPTLFPPHTHIYPHAHPTSCRARGV